MRSSLTALTILVLITALVAVICAPQETAAKPSYKKKRTGRRIYMSKCYECHVLGKNVINPNKEIVTSAKLATLETFKEFLSKENGLMPSFPDIVKNDKQLASLYTFTKALKNQSWEYEPQEEDRAPKEPPSKTPKPDGGFG